MYISQSWTTSAFWSRKAWFRSPYQRKKPVSVNRKASAAVTITLSFWPALKRPCGLPRRGSRRASGAVAIRPPHPRVLVVAVLLPVAARLLGDELHPRQPLDALVAVHLRQDHPSRRSVRARERLMIELQREHGVGEPQLLERERVVVRVLHRDKANRGRRGQRLH